MNELAVIQSPNVANPYKNFNVADMLTFYAAKKFLCCKDATELLNLCIYKQEEIRHYERTFNKVSGTYYIDAGILGMMERNDQYCRDYTVERIVLVSTSLFMDKLDCSLYFWRQLNPELVRLLSQSELVKMETITNWVRMIHYLSPAAISANI